MSKPAKLLANLRLSLKRQGLMSTVRDYSYWTREKYNDWRLGIRTVGKIYRTELGIVDPQYHQYEPTDYRTIRRAMRFLRIRENEDVFLDYGSGLGRVVVVAATYPFRRVIGVEFFPQLNALAADNMRRAEKKLRCKNIELVTADAAAYELPADVSVVFLYNPFEGQVLSRVFQNIRKSLAEVPRKLTVVFKNPVHFQAELAACDWLVERRKFLCYSRHEVVILEAQPC